MAPTSGAANAVSRPRPTLGEGLRLPVLSRGPNPERLGKFIANVPPGTKDAEVQKTVELLIERNLLPTVVAAHEGVRAIATVRADNKFAQDTTVVDMFRDGRGSPTYNPIWTCEVRCWTPSNYHDMQEGYYLKRDVYGRVDGTWRGAMSFKDLLQ